MRRCLSLAVILAVALPAALLAGDADWLTDENGVLALKLAHLDKNGPDGGVLKVDRQKHVMLWEGAGGEMSCKTRFEVSFDDVKSVAKADGPGFVVELKKGKPKSLTLIPIFHANWLLDGYRVSGLSSQQAIKDSPMMVGPGGGSITANGGAGAAGPTVKKVDLPKDVVADTQQAVDSVLAAMGRK